MANLTQFADFMNSTELPEFTPRPYYERKTDSLIFYMRDSRSEGHRLNSQLTLFLDVIDKTLVGIEVKGVKRTLEIAKSFGVMVFDNKIKLGAFMAFALAEAPEDEAIGDRYCDDLKEWQDQEIDSEELATA